MCDERKILTANFRMSYASEKYIFTLINTHYNNTGEHTTLTQHFILYDSFLKVLTITILTKMLSHILFYRKSDI